jgi:hypothetical protein
VPGDRTLQRFVDSWRVSPRVSFSQAVAFTDFAFVRPDGACPRGGFLSASPASAVAGIHAVRLAVSAVGACVGATLQRRIGWISRIHPTGTPGSGVGDRG